MSANKAFKQWMKQRFNDTTFKPFEHDSDCYYVDKESNVPLDEQNCDCYDKAVFRAGYFAAKGVTS